MIRYALKCDGGHAFESWFANGAAFDALSAAGHLSCPECGSSSVKKALMAPRVSNDSPARDLAPAAALAKLRREIEANSTDVGRTFARRARDMHEGREPHAPIRGQATLGEAKSLVEDGVPIAPLPFGPKPRDN